jgi:hypothetical protein
MVNEMPIDEEARTHMRRCPDHEVVVKSDDEWHCLTCEDEDLIDEDLIETYPGSGIYN